jgi:hypothetical protein
VRFLLPLVLVGCVYQGLESAGDPVRTEDAPHTASAVLDLKAYAARGRDEYPKQMPLEIARIIATHCLNCHAKAQPSRKMKRRRLDEFDVANRAFPPWGPPGKEWSSARLYRRISLAVREGRMPKVLHDDGKTPNNLISGPMKDSERETLTTWADEGEEAAGNAAAK